VTLGLAVASASAKQDTTWFPMLMPKAKPTKAESYLCTPVRLSTESTEYIVGFKPNATKMTAHHMLLYGCDEPGSMDSTWNCGEMSTAEPGLEAAPICNGGSRIIYAWGMDAPALSLPKGVGFRVGGETSTKYLVLQVHYMSVDHIPASGDDSGVFLEFTEQKQPKTAGVILLGTGGYAPKHSTTYFETSCKMTDPRPLHPFAFRTHTHALGKMVSGWRVRKNSADEMDWTLLGKKSPQEPQMFYDMDDKNIIVKQGDILAARCTMVNNRDRTTYIGATAADEMCNFYMMYWVQGEQPVTPDTCFTNGAPGWSWKESAGLKNIPDDKLVST